MTTIRKNIVANYAGKAWVAVINVAFIPLYIKYMGIEAYGLVGFFATLQPFLSILDMGISPSVNRELARYSVHPGQEQKMRDLVRTLEVIYWAMAIGLLVITLSTASALSTSWLQANSLPPAKIRKVLLLMGVSLVLQWPVGYYAGGLMGLQRQVLLNVMNSILWTIRGVGAVLVVIISSDKVVAFFVWQVVMSFLNVLAVSLLLWRSLPNAPRAARFDPGILKSVWRLALGMSAVSVTILLFNQMDKVILSRQISLSMFGYYSLAWQVVGCLFLFYYPVYAAFFPAITQAFSQGDREGLVKTYRKGSQLMSVSTLPVAVVIIMFSKDILRMWTNNAETAEQCHLVLSLLMVGATFNGMFYMQYAVRQAVGSMSRFLHIFVPALVVFTATLFSIVPRFGMVGAAVAFSTFSILQVGIAIYWTHRDCLPGEHSKWLIYDLVRPLFVSVAVAGVGRWFVNWDMVGVKGILTICLISLITYFAAAYATLATRQLMKEYCRRLGVGWGTNEAAKP